MRVMYFQGRQMGVAYNLPGENPMAEIGELLGGVPDEEMVRLDRRLVLVVREDREELSNQYVVQGLGMLPRLVAGDCVVVRMDKYQRMGDVNAQDAVTAQGYVRPLEVVV